MGFMHKHMISMYEEPLLCRLYAFELPCSGIFEINCSKDVKVQGIIGPCASLEKVFSEAFQSFKSIYLVFFFSPSDINFW